MRDPLGVLLIFILIGLMIGWDKPVSLSLNGQRSGTVTETNDSKSFSPLSLLSEAELPAEASLWSGCCSHRDCMEARVSVANQNADWAKVSIAYFPTFDLETKKIHPSKNGKDYFCRQDLSLPPDSKNTRCVFKGRPDYVTALRDNG